jgi:hypothetical protein
VYVDRYCLVTPLQLAAHFGAVARGGRDPVTAVVELPGVPASAVEQVREAVILSLSAAQAVDLVEP